VRLASKDGIGWGEKQAFRWFRLRKKAHQLLRYRVGCPKTVLFIVGCQRSGTSMIHHVFRSDFQTVTFDEVSPLSSADAVEGLRLNPLDDVRRKITAARAPLVIAKPLVESQNLEHLLAAFPGSRALWMYRNFQDVARSNLRFFGENNGHRDLQPILAGDQGNWRAEHLDPRDREAITDLYRPDMDPHDAAALFWYARNSLYFSRGYAGNERIRLCRYEDLVSTPGPVMAAVYDFVGRPYPGDGIVADVFSSSKGKGRDLVLAEPVRGLCRDLLERLDAQPRAGVTASAD